MQHLELVPIFFAVALIYASAGFGGGSSYLAAMALWGIAPETMRPTALLCNLVVVSGGSWIFWKNRLLDLRKTFPFVAASVPLAFVGGYFLLSEKNFFLLLAVSLIAAAMLMVLQKNSPEEMQTTGFQKISTPTSAAIGGATGLLSGMVGIGGGIFLAPILHLLRFDQPKKIAATASFFILVNSLAGLAGNLSKNLKIDWTLTLPLLVAVWLGGQIGSRWSALRGAQLQVRCVTAAVIFYAGFQILMKNL